MDINAQKSRFSLSYIEAVASQAGFHITEIRVDQDSVDGSLIGDFGRRPRIEFQAKATSQDILHGSSLHFPLSIKNYDELRLDAWTPRLLIVLLMPNPTSQWINQTTTELCLRHCAYWHCLEGKSSVPNIDNITVEVPTTNLFDSQQLTTLMQRAERGDALC